MFRTITNITEVIKPDDKRKTFWKTSHMQFTYANFAWFNKV